ncbi:gustatory receptor for sugar taste 64a-like [Bradysia coprophila]|uniref:gustatory receptor for sugar taste 64a-like n=1 Tax=Bradysia coprophila TaxID=38358 RepID=UPI00187DA8B6|nr:gustatory receptor for sugar taste 64a-like [Bradysia coprophila]
MITMLSVVKKDKKPILKKRNKHHLNVNIETVRENKVSIGATNLLEMRNESFFKSVWPAVIYFAQFMGFMPVQGIRTGDPFKFEFRWKTFRVMITMLYVVLGVSLGTMYLRRIARIGINAKNIAGFVFYSVCVSIGLLFLILAQKWKNLAMKWHQREKIFLNLPYKECGWSLSTKIRITAGVILFLAIVRTCEANVDDAWKYFFLNEHPHVFMVVPYHFLLTILIEWAIISFTFGWNYIDTFIMITSIALATRFKQINQRLEEIKNEPMVESSWAEIRHHHVLLCELVETVDNYLVVIIILCYANDLYYVCFELLNIFNKLPHFINFIYFWYSFLYLVGRTTGVFLIAASINDAATYPIKFVRRRHTTEWCAELERFGDQISTRAVALSGLKFFFITRSLLFGMAGTIVTYELVLLQFDESSEKKTENVTSACDAFI